MEIKKFLDDYKKISKTEVIGFLKEHADEDLTSAVLGRAFERLYIDVLYVLWLVYYKTGICNIIRKVMSKRK